MSHFLIFKQPLYVFGHEMLAIVFLPAFNPHRRLDLKISVFRYMNRDFIKTAEGAD